MEQDEYLVWLNGDFAPISKACVNVCDHGLLYGDGIFEGIRAYNGKIFKLIMHVDRLFDSAKMINLDIGKTKKEIIGAILDTLRINNLNEAYIRLVVTRGVGDLSLNPTSCKESTIFIVVKPIPPMANPIGITAITSTIRRVPHSVFSPNIKSLNYLNNVLAHMDARLKGVDEAVMLDIDGNVAECTGENIFMMKDGILITPPHINSLKGITRSTILDLASENNFIKSIDIRHISLFELYAADEIFITGTASEIAPVIKLDGRNINKGIPGKVTLSLQNSFKKYSNKHGYPIFDY